MSEFSKRVLKPASLPLIIIAVIGVLVFSLSRILLAVPEAGSTSIALMLAAEVLGVASVLAAGSRVKASQRAVLLLTGVGLLGAGAASAAIGTRTIEQHGTEIVIAAKDIAFDKQELHFPADTEVDLKFVNNDVGIPHNVSIYRDEAMTEGIVVEPPFNGVASQTYAVPPLAAGRYPYRCDVHPNMKGEVVAAEGGGGAPHGESTPTTSPTPTPSPTVPVEGGGPALTEVDMVAKDIAFDKSEIALKASQTVQIHFQNLDQGIPHNVVVAREIGEGIVFREAPFNGVEHAEYEFQAPAPGTYIFYCEVHLNMKGTAVFR